MNPLFFTCEYPKQKDNKGPKPSDHAFLYTREEAQCHLWSSLANCPFEQEIVVHIVREVIVSHNRRTSKDLYTFFESAKPPFVDVKSCLER